MQCAMLQTVASAEQYHNHIRDQIQRILSQQNKCYLHKQKLDSPHLWEDVQLQIILSQNMNFLNLGSKHPTVFFTDHNSIIYLFT